VRTAVAVSVLCVAGSSVLSQSFNIDFGNANPAPAATYGAASGSAGFWNPYAGGPMGLANLSGSPTAVTISGGPTGFLAGFNDPLTLGDDDALLDDYIGIPFIDTWTVSGLAAGTYDVYGYTWTFGPLSTGIDVNGQGVQVIGGVWPGSFTPGTYSYHTVTLAANQPLVIDVYSINGALGTIAGLQIVAVPAPSAGALLAIGAGLLGRRRAVRARR